MRVTNQNIFNVLTQHASGDIVSWKQMMADVSAAGMNIKNWMTVRNVLQYMKDKGIVQRTQNIHVEEYVFA